MYFECKWLSLRKNMDEKPTKCFIFPSYFGMQIAFSGENHSSILIYLDLDDMRLSDYMH